MLGNPPTDFQTTFGSVLRRLRKAAGMSQEALAFEAELQRNYISLMELGRYQPTLSTIFKLAHALAMPASALVLQVEQALSDPRRKPRQPKKPA